LDHACAWFFTVPPNDEAFFFHSLVFFSFFLRLLEGGVVRVSLGFLFFFLWGTWERRSFFPVAAWGALGVAVSCPMAVELRFFLKPGIPEKFLKFFI